MIACPVRAITRCGELLKAIQPASGNQYTVLQEGTLPKQTREQAAEDQTPKPAMGWGKRWGRPKT